MSKLLLIALLLGTVFILSSDARRQRGKPRGQDANCSVWTFSACAPKNTQTACGKGTKQGTRTGDTCQLKEKTFPCRIKCQNNNTCQYRPSRQIAQAAQCDPATGKKTYSLPLTRGDPATCAPNKVIQKNCNADRRGNGRRPVREARRNQRPETELPRVSGRQPSLFSGLQADSRTAATGGGRQQRCKYTKGAWSQCDTTTTTRTRTLTAKPNSPATCQPTKQQTKPCKNAGGGGSRAAKSNGRRNQ